MYFQAQKCDLLTALEREEMWERTRNTPIPEFYAGSTLRIHYKPQLDKDNIRTVVSLRSFIYPSLIRDKQERFKIIDLSGSFIMFL